MRDEETGELRPTLSRGMREHDVTVGCENVFAELLDLQASGSLNAEFDVWEVAELIDVNAGPRLNIAGFGEDRAGELYILAFDGRIHRLAARGR